MRTIVTLTWLVSFFKTARSTPIMVGLDPGIHAQACFWILGSSPRMTECGVDQMDAAYILCCCGSDEGKHLTSRLSLGSRTFHPSSSASEPRIQAT